MAIYLYEDNRGKVLFLDWYRKIREKDQSIYRKVNDMLTQWTSKPYRLPGQRLSGWFYGFLTGIYTKFG